MSLIGNAAVVIWNDVIAERRDDFMAWHNREHIPERVGIPGFLRGRRARATVGGPEFLTLYEIAEAGVLHGGDYLARLNSPTAWTRRILPEFRNTARSLCRVTVSVGGGIGGFLCTVRFPDEPRRDRQALSRFRALANELLGDSAALLGVHLLVRDLESSRQEIAEQKLRSEAVAMPGAVLITEGTAEDAVAAAARQLSDEFDRLAMSPGQGAVTGIYRHELCLTAGDIPERTHR